MKVGFVTIFGLPNAGKSTLINAIMGEKLAIVSPKVQTTRHRIRVIYSNERVQIVFSDTPGIIEPRYKLHERMMHAVKSSMEDADLALLLVDAGADPGESDLVFQALRLKVPALVVLNKLDQPRSAEAADAAEEFFRRQPYCRDLVRVSALKGSGVTELLAQIEQLLPDGEPFFSGEDLSDLPSRFFVGEIIREKIYQLCHEEIPYQAAVQVRAFEEKSTLVKISADIIVSRESQKAILIGEKGSMIRRLGTLARADIESFLGSQVFLELFVKVRRDWRENDTFLKEYGY